MHAHVRVCGYVAYIFEYCARVGLLTLTVFVTLSNEVYNRRTAKIRVNKMMNNLVDIFWFWNSYWSVVGGIDGNKLRFRRKYFNLCQKALIYPETFGTKLRDKVLYYSKKD